MLPCFFFRCEKCHAAPGDVQRAVGGDKFRTKMFRWLLRSGGLALASTIRRAIISAPMTVI
ncbi:hypothetical protein KCP78_24835 [Salmonella enterica subsp. enterica]|nr:hypothetical protein KCP78_24835 [Salmonella enterica subsp. enterica]